MKPRWLQALIGQGRQVEEFAIPDEERSARKSAPRAAKKAAAGRKSTGRKSPGRPRRASKAA